MNNQVRMLEKRHCDAGIYCFICRNLEGGRTWRASLTNMSTPDFECPHGKPWGFAPETKAGNGKPSSDPAYFAERQAACDACPVAPESCAVQFRRRILKKTCWFRSYLLRAGASCPLDPPRWRPVPAERPKDAHPSRGLGDTVEKVLNATGVGQVTKWMIHRVTGKPCRCGERREKLNRRFPYKQYIEGRNHETP